MGLNFFHWLNIQKNWINSRINSLSEKASISILEGLESLNLLHELNLELRASYITPKCLKSFEETLHKLNRLKSLSLFF
jgi:hypothetical protein